MKYLLTITFLLLANISFAQENVLGQRVYEAACQNCHAPNLAKAIKAPAAFDKSAWAKRFEIAKSKSGPGKRFKTPYDYLAYSVTIGRGLMHHHGLCLEANLPKEDCSKPAYIAAIKYMAGIKNGKAF